MANVLPREKRLAVLAALVDGNSIRAAERMTGVHRDTVMRFGIQFGEGCDRLHNRVVRDLSCSLIDVDEQRGFVNTKTSNMAGDAPKDGSKGDAWTWVAIDRSSRMAVAYHVGKRDQAAADAFAMDLRSRLAVMPTLMTSDGLSLYVTAILTAFGPAAPLAQTVKNYSYGLKRTPDHKYAQPHMGEGSFITKRAALGAPNLDLASTSKVEVNNLLARHKNGRMRRLCLAFSKSLRGHKAAASLFYTHYNSATCSEQRGSLRPLRRASLTIFGVWRSSWMRCWMRRPSRALSPDRSRSTSQRDRRGSFPVVAGGST